MAALLDKAKQQYNRGDYKIALATLRRLIQQDRRNADAHILTATIHEQQDNRELAADFYASAMPLTVNLKREVGFRALSPSAGHRVREKSLLRRPAESSTLRGGCALRGYHSLHFSNKNRARVWMPILLRLRIGNRLMVEMFRCVHKSCAQKTNATGLLQVQCRAWQRDIIRHGDTGLFRGVHRPVTGAFLAGSVTSAQQQQTREHARARPLGLVLSR